MVLLETSSFKIAVTLNHRVVVLRAGWPQTIPAAHLRVGDSVLSRRGEKDLLDVASYEDTYFEIPQRLAEAEAWSSATPACTPDQIHSLWLGRVRTAMCITTASHQL